MMKAIFAVTLAFATCAAFAAVKTQTFDDIEDVPANWSGDKALVSARGGQVLSVGNEASCANAGSDAQWAKSAFIVRVPEEESDVRDLPTSGDDKMTDCQIAVAIGPAVTEGENAGKLKVMVYCRGESGACWTDSGVVVTKSTESKTSWMAVVLNCDYGAGKAQLVINSSDAGWYRLANATQTTSKINNLLFVGPTQVDDLSIAEVQVPTAIKDLTVDLETLGVTMDQIVANATVGSSGLTVQQKIEAGLNPTDNSTFTATALMPAPDGKIAVTVPCAFNNGQKYTVVMTDETGVSTETTVDPVIDGVNKTATLTVTPGSGKVLKFQVKASASAPAAQ